jgi:hypothetical protein
MLKSYSLASVAIAMRYSSLYRTFDINQEYTIPAKEIKPFYLTRDKFSSVYKGYTAQDKLKGSAVC